MLMNGRKHHKPDLPTASLSAEFSKTYIAAFAQGSLALGWVVSYIAWGKVKAVSYRGPEPLLETLTGLAQGSEQ